MMFPEGVEIKADRTGGGSSYPKHDPSKKLKFSALFAQFYGGR